MRENFNLEDFMVLLSKELFCRDGDPAAYLECRAMPALDTSRDLARYNDGYKLPTVTDSTILN